MNINLLLIEDELQDANDIVECIGEFSRNEWGNQFHIEHLLGNGEEIKIRDRVYRFYDDNIINDIEERIDKIDTDTRIGLLLDIVLTEEELDSKNRNFYPEVKVARRVYDAFNDRVPIYIITSVSNFFTHSEKIMGVDLSDQFILKDVLLKYKTQSMIDKFTKFYVDWSANIDG